MPHATNAVNGEKASSQFINRLSSYPAVNDGVETFKSNPYGKKSLELVDEAYSRFGKPVEPYLETPWAYAKPYVLKGDELADNGLGRVENHFPIVKEDTHTIVETAKSYAFWPYNYLNDTWSDEYHKTAKHNGRGPGITTSVLAIISTELRVAADFFHAVADFLGPKYEETKKSLGDTAESYKQFGQDKLSEYQKIASDKLSEAQKVGEQKTEEAKNTANKASHDAQEHAKKTSHEAQEHAKKTKDEAHKKASK